MTTGQLLVKKVTMADVTKAFQEMWDSADADFIRLYERWQRIKHEYEEQNDGNDLLHQ